MFMCSMKKKAKGFTIIEIGVALLIIGIMAGIVIPNVMRYIKQAKVTKTNSALQTTKNLIMEYNGHTGAYPMSLNDLVNRPNDPKVASRWQGPYAEEKDFVKGVFVDGWMHELVYQRTPGQQRPFALYSYGENGEGAPQEEWIDAWTL